MNKYVLYAFTAVAVVMSCTDHKTDRSQARNIVDYVDPFIGTGGHGHTYPGASSPFGRMQPSPDNGTTGWDWCSGYHITDSIISGFAQLHLSGTGIGDLADVLLMPTNSDMDLGLFGKKRDSLPYTSHFSHEGEEASPGYYKVHLNDPDITVELTANDYVAYHRYTYQNAVKPSFVVDLGYAVNWDKPLESSLKMEDSRHIVGYRFSTGWAKNQKVFFAMETSRPIVQQRFIGDAPTGIASTEVHGVKAGGQFFFKGDTDSVEVKIAVSSVSIENAKANLSSQGNPGFGEIREKTRGDWGDLLSNITVETPTDSLKTIFYTALYHAQVAPTMFNDLNGEFRMQNDSIAKTDFKMYSSLSLWDIYRAETPLLSIIDPNRLDDMVRSMLVYYDESGVLPVWVLSGNETGTMPGYHSVSIIAEAIMKGHTSFDVQKAYTAMKETMMGDERGLKAYKEYGYIPYEVMDQSVSISLEYAYNDWCVAQVAKKLGYDGDYAYFDDRSKAYRNFFDGGSGFLRGKSKDGKNFHEPFDPKSSNHIEDTDYTEGNAWQHSWYVLHDVAGLMELHGKMDSFALMVERLFTEDSDLSGHNVSPDISGLIGQYAHGNEPSHHIAYMLNKADAPWRTQYWVRKIMDTQYSTKPDGLSGNEDCGQMSAWYIMSAMGIYPMNPASGEYEIGSPIFEKTTIKLPGGKTFVISAPDTSQKNIYVQSVKLNGELLDRTYIMHGDIVSGGTLEFEMGPTPNKEWGVKKHN
ncbi:GH92 family glycosyl hydrolase [Maribacter polysaccharolyticus]|uniref:GH92 family glycosyl hydrolase n=1 Tax=Maribacter polysaccharolyticus TaxID=3020831 RepID=UPI00237FA5D2|nr:GH92 family glycosyl hydrolase [Maribacter polysaccharolyticus]MDE3741790.1 GH92 family glycosyl hydrolase [Maribacter polysaccharolyticus]